MDCLFLHVSKQTKYSEHIIQAPVGVPALAWFLKTRGNISSEIMSLPLEKLVKNDFKIDEYIKKNQIKIICMDLHWHPQAFDVIKNAILIKKSNPVCKIILGGFTASFFAKEIMGSHGVVDFIIRGDAEIPLLELTRLLIKGVDDKAYRNIPNLLWRDNGRVIINDQSYVITQKILDELEYSNLSLVRHHDIYTKLPDTFLFNKKKKGLLKRLKLHKRYFLLNIGRGCSVNCSYCGGSRDAQNIINKRNKVLLKSHDSVMRDLINLNQYSIDTLYIAYDPIPSSKYYIELFDKIKKANLQFNLQFESFAIPTKPFIDKVIRTFGEDSIIIISPESGSEKVRKLNKGFFYSNRMLLNILSYIYEKKMHGQLFFALGLPFESIDDTKKTVELIRLINSRFHYHFKIILSPIELDPACPMWLNNDKFKITAERKTFQDLYNANKDETTLGYFTETFSSGKVFPLAHILSSRLRISECQPSDINFRRKN